MRHPSRRALLFAMLSAAYALGGRPAAAQPVPGQPPRPGPVAWQASPAAPALLAARLGGATAAMPPVQAALYDVGNGRQLLLATGGPWVGASTVSAALYLSTGGDFSKVGAVPASWASSVPMRVGPPVNGMPSFTAAVTAPARYDRNVSMAQQHFTTRQIRLVFDPRTGMFVTR